MLVYIYLKLYFFGILFICINQTSNCRRKHYVSICSYLRQLSNFTGNWRCFVVVEHVKFSSCFSYNLCNLFAKVLPRSFMKNQSQYVKSVPKSFSYALLNIFQAICCDFWRNTNIRLNDKFTD